MHGCDSAMATNFANATCSNVTQNITWDIGWTWFAFCFSNLFIWKLMGSSALAELHQREQHWGRLCPLRVSLRPSPGADVAGQGSRGMSSRAVLLHRKGCSAQCALPGVILLYRIGLLITFSVSLLSCAKIVHNCGVRSPGAQRSELRGLTNERLELMFWATTHRNQQTNIKPPRVGFWSTSDAPIHKNSLLCSATIVNSQDTEY